MNVETLLKSYEWDWGHIFIYAYDWYKTDDKEKQLELDKLYTVFSTIGQEDRDNLEYRDYIKREIIKFDATPIWIWWVDEQGLKILLDHRLWLIEDIQQGETNESI
jgi:hypothetical protein